MKPSLFCFIAFAVLVFSLFPVVYCEEDYRITGRVVDENGLPLKDVQVSVYSDFEAEITGQSYGYFITKVLTKADGRYRINVDRCSFTLVYSKKGYNKEVQTVNFVSVFNIDLENLAMKNALVTSLKNETRKVSPGKLFEIPFSIINTYNSALKLGFSIDSGDCEAQLLDSSGEIIETMLDPDAAIDLVLRLKVPYSPGETRDISLRIDSDTRIVRKITLIIDEESMDLLRCSSKSLQCEPGGTARFNINVNNPFHYALESNLVLIGLPDSWDYTLFNEDNARIYKLCLESDFTTNLTLEIKTDPDTCLGSYNFSLMIHTMGENEELPLNLRLAEIQDPVYLTTRYPEQSVDIGDVVSYSVDINNPTKESATLVLDADFLPEGWKADFRNNDGLKIGSVHLDSESSETVVVKITPSLDSSLGSYVVEVSARSDTLSGALPLNINLLGSHNGVLVLSSLYEKIVVGESKSISIRLANTGYSDLTNVLLKLDSTLEGFETEIEPIRVNRIKSGESATVTLWIKGVDGASTGDYVLKLKAVSNEYVFEEKQIRVTLSLGSKMLYISCGLLVLGVGLLVMALRFIRRR